MIGVAECELECMTMCSAQLENAANFILLLVVNGSE